MLSPQAVAVTAEPDGRSAPEVSLDARVRRCRVGTTGNRGQFRLHTGLMVPFGDGHQGDPTPKSTSASHLSGECRQRRVRVAQSAAPPEPIPCSILLDATRDWRSRFLLAAR